LPPLPREQKPTGSRNYHQTLSGLPVMIKRPLPREQNKLNVRKQREKVVMIMRAAPQGAERPNGSTRCSQEQVTGGGMWPKTARVLSSISVGAKRANSVIYRFRESARSSLNG